MQTHDQVCMLLSIYPEQDHRINPIFRRRAMNTVSTILIMLIAIASGLFTYFQYFFKKGFGRERWLPAFFRFLAIFLTLSMFLSQSLELKEKVLVKPKLYILADNSGSIKWQNAENQVLSTVGFLQNDADLLERFELESYSFENRLELLDTLGFSGNQTNLSGALYQLDRLSNGAEHPLVLVSDGIQTYGNDYAYMNISPTVYPVLVGDTTSYDDLEIYLVNSNKYATLDSEFEIEVFARYSGSEEIKTTLRILEGESLLFEKGIDLSGQQGSSRIKAKLKADRSGLRLFKATLDPLSGEKQVLNNQKAFEIEILDQRSKVALIYQTLHPDLGMLKRSIENGDKREVNLLRAEEFDGSYEDYQAFILYQPVESFRSVFEGLSERDMGYFLITGTSTDWKFLNRVQNGFQKDASYLYEDSYAQFLTDFDAFDTDDLGFAGFPPLRSSLGTLRFNTEQRILLRRLINGVLTDDPLLTVYEEGGIRKVALFGENIWKWRMQSFDEENGVYGLDNFMQSLIQYLYLSQDRETLEVEYKNVFYQDEPVIIRAKKYNSDLRADRNAELKVNLGESATPMYLRNDLYEARIGELGPGNYQFEVVDEASGSSKAGKFEIVAYSAEQRDLRADMDRMQRLAGSGGQMVFDPFSLEELKRELLESERYVTVEKTESKNLALIDWKLFLVLIILSLSIEWFIRKYRGLN